MRRFLRRLQPPDFAEEDGKTALYSAAFTGNIGLGHLLMDYDADPELPDQEFGLYPMHVAALHGWEDFVELLIEHKVRTSF